MSAVAGSANLRGIQAGLAGAVALAVVLALVAPPLTAAEERARREADAALTRSGLTPVGGPVVVGERSLFDDPGDALLLALGCAAAGIAAGLALGWTSKRRDGALADQLVPVVLVGSALTLTGLGVAGLLRWREIAAFAAFWAVTAAAVLIGERSPRPRPPT